MGKMMAVCCMTHFSPQSSVNSHSAGILLVLFGTLKLIIMFTKVDHWTLPKHTKLHMPITLTHRFLDCFILGSFLYTHASFLSPYRIILLVFHIFKFIQYMTETSQIRKVWHPFITNN